MTWTLQDTDVWTNAAYIFPGFAAVGIDPFSAGIVVAAGGVLALLSAAFHTAEDVRHAQRLDIAAMMGFLASILAALLIPVTDWAALLVPVAWGVYYRYKWSLDSHRHVAGWALLILGGIAYAAGWWALVPAGLFAGAVALKKTSPGPNSLRHALWHVAGAAAAASGLWVVAAVATI